MISKALKREFLEYAGSKYDPPGGGPYRQTIIDFTAGWNACQKYLLKCWDLLPDMEHEDIPEIKSALQICDIEKDLGA